MKTQLKVANGQSLHLPKGTSEDDVLKAGIAAIKEKVAADAKKGKTWSGTVTLRVEEVARPFLVKNFADGYILYKPHLFKESEVVVTVKEGKTVKL